MMFSSPAIRVFSEENNSSVVKKPGLTNAITKKPFSDRTVNASPQKNQDINLKKPEAQVSKCLSNEKIQEDELFLYDSFTYKNFEDNYSDIKHLSEKAIFNCLKAYCGYNCETPTGELSPDINMFLEMAENEFIYEPEDILHIEDSTDDVSLPEIDFD